MNNYSKKEQRYVDLMLILTLISVSLMIGGIIYSDNTLLALSAIIGIISTGILFFGIIGIDMLFDIWREVK
jgi:archaellum biogenesis protein FlaJ (TadC family)